MSDLVARLRTMAGIGWNPIGAEAADHIEAQAKRIAELEAANERLRKFVILFQCVDWDHGTEHDDLLLETLREQADELSPRAAIGKAISQM